MDQQHLDLLTQQLRKGREKMNRLSRRTQIDTVRFDYPGGVSHTFMVPDHWTEVPELGGVMLKAVDTPSTAFSMVLKYGPAGAAIPLHSHPQSELLTVKEGRVLVKTDDGPGTGLVLERAARIFLGENEPHSIFFMEESVLEAEYRPRVQVDQQPEETGVIV